MKTECVEIRTFYSLSKEANVQGCGTTNTIIINLNIIELLKCCKISNRYHADGISIFL